MMVINYMQAKKEKNYFFSKLVIQPAVFLNIKKVKIMQPR